MPSCGNVRPYTFSLSDLDFNRHVTTTRYVDLMVDTIPLDLYDRSRIARIDLAFHREARYADSVDIISGMERARRPLHCDHRRSHRPVRSRLGLLPGPDHSYRQITNLISYPHLLWLK